MSALTVAVLEDDDVLRERILIPGLVRFGFDVHGFGSILALKKCLASRTFELVILDIGLPDGSGFAVARELRERHPSMGLVVLTSRAEGADHVRGLAEGADSYLTKPVELEVLAANLHSLARRLSPTGPTRQTVTRWQLSVDEWCLISPSGKSAALTAAERKLCRRLFGHPGQLVEREALIESMTDQVHDFDAHRLDSMIHRLRSKALSQCETALPLKAVQGRGYILTP